MEWLFLNNVEPLSSIYHQTVVTMRNEKAQRTIVSERLCTTFWVFLLRRILKNYAEHPFVLPQDQVVKVN